MYPDGTFGLQSSLRAPTGVEFTLEQSVSNGLGHHDISIIKSSSPIHCAHHISNNGRHRNSPNRPRGRFQREARRKYNHPPSGDLSERSKGQLQGAEENESFKIAVQRGNLEQVERILEDGE